ncbi:MAG: DMT family transporter [Sphaerochaetaceae bacterium]|nr:DMT family transporter [Sphaerochaetaceae bacterium]MDD4006619.1 DMT family transporter [Sphaerochaetaceae bacterium]
MNTKSVFSSLALLLTAMVWGLSFVAQSVGMDSIGPLTFNYARYFMAFVVLIPISARRFKSNPLLSQVPDRKTFWKKAAMAGFMCGWSLAVGIIMQQYAILTLPVGKVGFLTAFYVILVPIFGLALRQKARPVVWVCCFAALIGMYLMCMGTGRFVLESGDVLGIGSAVLFAVYIIIADHYAPYFDGIFLTCVQMLFASFFCFVPKCIFEPFSLKAIEAGIIPLLYSGIVSSALGTSLEMIAQKNVHPAAASLIMSLESVFSLVFGWIILGQRMSAIELSGCLAVFIAVVVSQIPGRRKAA